MASPPPVSPASPVFQATGAFAPGQSVADHFDKAARRDPAATALLAGARRVTYGDLDGLSRATAARLVAAGIGPGARVGLVATRSVAAVAGLLGILRSGAAAVPLDPGHAPEQLSFIVTDARPAALLSTPADADMARSLAAPDLPVLEIPRTRDSATDTAFAPVDGNAPALVLYTSGTTGRPKGVVLPHRAIGALALGDDVTRLRPDDVMLHALPIACDGAVYDIFGALLNGAALAVVDKVLPSLDDIAAVMRDAGVTVANWYAGVHHLMIEHRIDAFAGLRLSIAGGDVMSPGHARRLLAAHPGLVLVNDYGPTEATTHCLAQVVTPQMAADGPIPLGVPLAHDQVFLLDDTRRPAPPGAEGQIAVAGPGVALGYLDRPEASARAFVPDPRPGQSGTVYLTGDLAVQRADGSFEFRGRADRQVKLNGHRVELDGVEHVLRAQPHVADAAVVLDADGRLAGFLRAAPGAPADLPETVRRAAAARLNDAALPRSLHLLDSFPLTPAGKVDRKALLAMRAPAATPLPEGDMAGLVAQVWDAVLSCGPVPRTATFFDAGGSSLQLMEAHAALEDRLGRRFDITLMFVHPRLGDLARALSDMPAAPHAPRATRPAGHAIAITGMAARLPGADSLPALWNSLRAGENLISRLDPGTLEGGVGARAHPAFVPARAVLDDVEMFDAKFFGMLPREAAVTDPQQRVFLELCQQALDDAALDPARFAGTVGVFAGQTTSTYMLANLLPDRAAIERFCDEYQLGDYALMTGNDTDSLATRVAFKLNLTGPALSVSTACSTSLTAIAQAVACLRAGQADAALAGGISITFPQRRGYLAQEGGMASPDGLCRPFDARAGGTVFGHGGGVLVLRRLDDAIAAGDPIHGVILGVGITNDGADKMAYTAPSVQGQAAAIRAAHRDAGVAPDSIGYVECHGTATPLGDPIELRALADAFGEGDARCAIGSLKGNIGHLDAGAGVAGVIKTLLMLRAREIPPVAHFNEPNPRIGIETMRFDIPRVLRPWDSAGPRRAGVSSFGVGGTNVHLVIEQAPDLPDAAVFPDAARPRILPLSAAAPEALDRMAQDLARALCAPDAPTLDDAALTLQEGRRTLPFRAAVIARTTAEAAERLATLAPPAHAASDAPPLAFLFPGQGAQYPGMGRGLYDGEPDFAHWIDRGADLLGPDTGEEMRRLLIRGSPTDGDAARALRDTRLTQPALFLVEYATAMLWAARGIHPDLMVGHSVGEFAAAALAGVMSFEDALALIARRGALMQAQPPGAMLSVRATLDALTPHLGAGIDLAAANAPRMQVLAGPPEAVAALESRLADAGIATRRLHTSHAFHCAMMDPVVAALETDCRAIALSPPRIPIVSTVTGHRMDDATATDPAYWARQARAPVRFCDALRRIARDAPPLLLEIGPGATLTALAAQTLGREGHRGLLHSLPDHADGQDDADTMATALAGLWCAGRDVDWSRAGPRGTRKVALPGVAFCRTRHWMDPPAATAPSTTAPKTPEVPMPQPPERAHSRRDRLTDELLAIFADLSGETLGRADADATFLELGLDSLFLGQAAQAVGARYGVQVGFRSLMADVPSCAALAAHLDASLPPDPAPKAEPAPEPAPEPLPEPAARPAPGATTAAPQGMEQLFAQQTRAMQELFRDQIRAISGAPQPRQAAPQPPPAIAPAAENPRDPAPRRGFQVGRAAAPGDMALNAAQLSFARDLARRSCDRFPASRAHTQRYRAVHADPRTAAGFREDWKDMVFPIVATAARGAYIQDADGNRLVDLVNGFGQTAFGHSPDFVTRAVAAQMEKGFPIGPQADLAGPVAERFAAMTGHERVTFCNTGSEAVMAAMRLARAVTGRERIVVFSGDYHGQFDEVLVKGRASGGAPDALPVAPGIPRSGLANMAVLGYGDPASLDWIRANIADIAGVIVEPVQSRNPAHRPAEFVRELRRITETGGAALVMDEVVTGFRTGPQGMQGLWGIQGDMATYGKVVGGGMPVGVLAGRRRFMDALDGGTWAYGDDSQPETAPTFFAGTFVRHPLVLAAVNATLAHMEDHGDSLWRDAAARSAALADTLRAALDTRGLPGVIEDFSSWHSIKTTRLDPRATLLFPLLRLRGVHALDSFCGFLTTAHTEAECRIVAEAFADSLDELQAVAILAPVHEPALVRPDPPPDTGVPLTEAQREIWMVHQMGDEAAASFNESVSITLTGDLDTGALNQALSALVARHDALRMRFARSGAHFDVTPPAPLPLALHDLSAGPDPDGALAAWLAEDAARPLHITREPPLRAALLGMGAARHVLVLTAHHIACDGWSLDVLFDELTALYDALRAGRTPDLAPPPSFAALARAAAAKRPDPAVSAYWRAQYPAIPALPDLPGDRPRPARKSWRGATTGRTVDAALARALRAAGARQGATLFAMLFAGLQMTLGRLSGASDVVLAISAAGQALNETPGQVGHCVHFLPVRAPFDPEEPASAHLSRVARTLLDAFEHGDTTLGALVGDLDARRGLDRMPLTEVQFNLERATPPKQAGGLTFALSPNPKAAVNFDLFFNVTEAPDGLRIDVDHAADIYSPDTVNRWIDHYLTLLAALAEDADRPVRSLPLMPPDQIAALDNGLNRTDRDFGPDTVLDLFARQVAQRPGDVAVEYGDAALDYATLDRRSDDVAAHLQTLLPGRGAHVAVALPRSAALPVALLGVLKAGHVYVPLDPAQPRARLQAILQQAQVAAVICDGDADSLAPDLPRVAPGDVPADARPRPVTHAPDDTAYVIFTSGSTGTPKGVEVALGALTNFLHSMAETPGFGPGSRILSVTTPMFDIAALELFLPLVTGGTCTIAGQDEVADAFALAQRLSRQRFTHLQSTPTLLDMLLEAGFRPGPDMTLLCGGEPLPDDLASRLMAHGAAVWNMYGPTETTIWSAIKRLSPGAPVTIGAPIANTALHVLDAQDTPVPIGVIGELNIAGAGLARGYHARPDLTDAAFRQVMLDGRAQRLYRTGDLARRLPNGEIQVLGRNDTQVKLRGFRIELGEVETRLRALPGVERCAVALRRGQAGTDRLIGYVVPGAGQAPDTGALAAGLSRHLPAYMIPGAWVMLSALPQTPNGKLDRNALPDPDDAATVQPLHPAEAPATATERRIAAIWAEVLSRPDVPVTTTIHALGVDSLAVFRIAARLIDDGLDLEARDLLAHPTIRALAALADARPARDGSQPSLRDFRRGAMRGQ